MVTVEIHKNIFEKLRLITDTSLEDKVKSIENLHQTYQDMGQDIDDVVNKVDRSDFDKIWWIGNSTASEKFLNYYSKKGIEFQTKYYLADGSVCIKLDSAVERRR